MKDHSRAFGPLLHFACLLGNKEMVRLFLDKGADVNETAGYFKQALFAALHGRHSDIVGILLERASLTDHSHPEYATPLHFACGNGDGASTRKLLEYGANVTVKNSKGETPLTLALKHGYATSPRETPLAAIIKLAEAVHILDGDLEAVASLCGYDDSKPLALLLKLDNDILLSEQFICRIFRDGIKDEDTIRLLLQKSGRIRVTAEIMEAARNPAARKMLHRYDEQQAMRRFGSRK